MVRISCAVLLLAAELQGAWRRHSQHAMRSNTVRPARTGRCFCSQLSSPVGEVGTVVGAGLDAGPLSAVKEDSKHYWAAAQS